MLQLISVDCQEVNGVMFASLTVYQLVPMPIKVMAIAKEFKGRSFSSSSSSSPSSSSSCSPSFLPYDLSVHYRTSTASSGSQWGTTDLTMSSDRMPEYMPNRMLEDVLDRTPEGTPDKTPECMSDKTP